MRVSPVALSVTVFDPFVTLPDITVVDGDTSRMVSNGLRRRANRNRKGKQKRTRKQL